MKKSHFIIICISLFLICSAIFFLRFWPFSHDNQYVYFYTSGKWDKVFLMIDRGADVNKQDSYGQTALHHASYTAPLEVIQRLVASGADYDIVDLQGRCPITIAAKESRWDVASFFFDLDGEIGDHICKEIFLYAIAKGQIQIASDIVGKGLSVNFYSVDGLTPLHIALASEFLVNDTERMEETIRFLLQNGSDVNALTRIKNNTGDSFVGVRSGVPVQQNIIQSPLSMAISSQNEKVISLLKEYGAE